MNKFKKIIHPLLLIALAVWCGCLQVQLMHHDARISRNAQIAADDNLATSDDVSKIGNRVAAMEQLNLPARVSSVEKDTEFALKQTNALIDIAKIQAGGTK